MDLIVEHGGRSEKVRVEAEAAGFVVEVGAVRYHVDKAEIRGGVVSLQLVTEGDGALRRHAEVFLERLRDGSWSVSRGGPLAAEVVTVADPLTHLARAAMAAAGKSGPQRVTAYMPGRVVAVLVEEGAEVAAGQGVVVLEAMKMQNEIGPEAAGVVRRILVAAGEAVDAGDPLFEIG